MLKNLSNTNKIYRTFFLLNCQFSGYFYVFNSPSIRFHPLSIFQIKRGGPTLECVLGAVMFTFPMLAGLPALCLGLCDPFSSLKTPTCHIYSECEMQTLHVSFIL